MGVLDKFLNAIKLNDEDDEYLDDDILDDEEDFLDDDEPEEKTRRSFLKKFGSRKDTSEEDDYDEDFDDLDDIEEDFDEEEPEPEPVHRKTVVPQAEKSRSTSPVVPKSKAVPTARQSSVSRSSSSVRDERPARQATSSKITPMRRSRRSEEPAAMEVCVIRPLSMENTREIADTLIENSTVILNLEGIDVELAQRIIDFASGACYSLNGTLQKVSSYIFVLGPSNVDITGDMQNILGGSAPSVRAGY